MGESDKGENCTSISNRQHHLAGVNTGLWEPEGGKIVRGGGECGEGKDQGGFHGGGGAVTS